MKNFIVSILFLVTNVAIAQTKDTATVLLTKPEPPEIKTFFGIAHPFYTFSPEPIKQNFVDYYAVAIPTGINIWKSKKLGYSFEIVTSIRTEHSISKVAYLLFHPGILYRLGKGYTVVGRLAFETSGRLGFTPIISKVLIKGKDFQIFSSFVLPARFGNGQSPTLSMVFLVGISF